MPLTDDFTIAPLPDQAPALPFVASPAAEAVRIAPLGPAACAALAFRVQGVLRVAAVVKATFQLVHDRPMVEVEPEPLATADRHEHDNPVYPALAVCELAPYLPRADVVMIGHAPERPNAVAGPILVRLLVARGHTLLSKHLGAQPRARVTGFGPIARSWPARRRLLGAFDPRLLDARIAEIPDGFPWAYFQTAPEDQRIDYLRGDEWIVLEGMHPELARVQSCLPGITAEARVYGLSPEPGGRPIALVADSLAIDADRQRCSVTWRGNQAIGGEAELGRIQILAGVHRAGRPLVFPATASPPAAAPRPVDRERALSGEMTLAPFPASAHASATPFEKAAPSSSPLSEERTLAPSPDASRAPATPFQQASAPFPPVSVVERPATPAPRRALSEEMTFALLPEAELRGPATPPALIVQEPLPAPPEPPAPPAAVAVAPPEPPPMLPAVAAAPENPPPEPPAIAAPPENPLGDKFAAAMARAREVSKRAR